MRELTPEQIRDLYLRDIPSPTLLEIGCNDGTDTLRFLTAFPSARIYCFEPDPRAIARFRQNVHDSRAVLTECAICDQDGIATFHGSSGRPPNVTAKSPPCCHLAEWDLSGSLYRPTGHLTYSPWVTFPPERLYSVKTLTLDTWISDHPEISSIDFIWADTQGAEASLIRGAPSALSITRYLYTEYYDRPLYENQVPLGTLRDMLPEFLLLGTYGDNALFQRK